MCTNYHVPLTDINHCLAGHLDRIDTARIQAHCRKCDECDSIRRLMIQGREEKGWYVADSPLRPYCFSDTTLAKYDSADSDLTDEERNVVEEHLRNCEGCQIDLRIIRASVQRYCPRY